MDRLVDALDSRRGIATYVVAVTLISGAVVAIERTAAGRHGYVGPFVLFVAVVVVVAIGGALAWRRFGPGRDSD